MIRRLVVKEQEVQFYEFLENPKEGIRLDVRYARTDNFTGVQVYTEPRVFLLKSVALDLLRVRDHLRNLGFGLVLFDGYRPWSVSKFFWDHSSVEMRAFLADPAEGSSHNRGCAVDLSLFHLESGIAVMMPSDFDEMNEKAFRDYSGGTDSARNARDALRHAMEANGFSGITNEWWHFNHHSRHEWPVMNFSFEEIVRAPKIQPLPQES
jgi:D-alanyl-D-alanine dipeptidase